MMKTQPTKPRERQYINLGNYKVDSNTERPGFPAEFFEDEDENEEDYHFLFGHNEEEDDDDYDFDDDIEVARKAEKSTRTERILGEVCFISGVIAVGAAVIGAIVLIARITTYPFIKKISKDLDW